METLDGKAHVDADRARLEELFHQLVERSPAAREEFLASLTGADADLAPELESLLAANETEGPLDRLTEEMAPASLAAPGDPRATLSGQSIGQYEIRELIGRGGMGDVYRARDTRLGRDVALKFLPEWLSRDPAARDRFVVEARSVSSIDHTNVCTLYDLGGSDDGRLFLIMPYYAGRSLKQRLAEGPLPVEEAVDVALQAARGLAAAHARGIVHRDVKPGNLLLTEDGRVKILDFGVAKLADVHLTRTGETPGTASYMSPEQRTGGDADARSDLWSLGAVLYEMLTGKRPTGPSAVRSGLASVPPALAEIVERLLAESPDDRYPDARSLAEDLTALAEGRGAWSAGPAPSVKRFLAELKRRSVFRVAAVYGVIGFAVIEVADAVFPRIPLPAWTVSLVVWLVLLGFPVALVLAWAFETSPGGGVRRTRPVRPAILDAIVAQPARRRWPIGLAGALGGALVVIGALWALGADWMAGGDDAPDRSAGPVGGPSDAAPAVAVLPFRTTGLASTDWGEGMVDMLSFNLDGVPGLRKVDPMSVMTAWRARSDRLPGGASLTPADALSVAETLGARYAVVGTALRPDAASDVRLAARVYDARTSELRGSVRVDGPADSLVRLVDDLTVEILRQSLVPVDGELPPVNLGRVTTSSLPALKAYLAGEERYRRGRYEEAVGHFQRAVERDSTFARALYRLSGAYGWEEEYGLARDYGERAARFADRLPERDSILVSLAARGHGMTDEFEDFVARYPDDADGWYRLGENRFHTQGVELLPPSAYRDALERAVELAPHYWEPYLHLLEDAIARLDRERLRKLLRAYEAIDSDGTPCAGPRLVHDLRWGSDSVRNRALAVLDTVSTGMIRCANTGVAGAIPLLEEAERRALADPDGLSHFTLWQLPLRRLWNGQPTAGRRVLATGKTDPSLRGVVAGHEIAFHLAGYTSAPEELHRAVEILREVPIVPSESSAFYRGFLINYFWLGALALSEGREEDLERATSVIATLASDRRRDDPARADSAAAYGIALREFGRLQGGDMERLDEFEAAMGIMSTFSTVAEYPAHYMRYEVGKLLLDRGDLPEAERYFRSLYPYAGPYFVPAQFYLGQIYEEQGDVERAREHYLLFTRWWEKADPELQPWRDRGLEALRRLAPDA